MSILDGGPFDGGPFDGPLRAGGAAHPRLRTLRGRQAGPAVPGAAHPLLRYLRRRSAPVASDILAAIQDWFAADTELVAAIPGGLRVTQNPGNPLLPYAVVVLVSETSEWASGIDQVDQLDLQFSIYAATAGEARAAGKLFMRKLDDASIAFADGYLMGFYHTQDTLTKDPNRGPRGFLWHMMFLTTAFVGRPK
jgi:hypothetical protein